MTGEMVMGETGAVMLVVGVCSSAQQEVSICSQTVSFGMQAACEAMKGTIASLEQRRATMRGPYRASKAQDLGCPWAGT